MRKRILALESLMTDETPISEAPTSAVSPEPMADEEVDAAVSDEDHDESMADIATCGNECDAVSNEIDQASATADTLSKIGEKIEATLPEGGMSSVAVEALSTAISTMCTQIGYKPSRANVFPAMEGFQNPKTRVHATKIALEDLKSKVAEIWAAIWERLKKLAEYAMSAIQRMAARINHLLSSTKSAEKAARAMTANPAAERVPNVRVNHLLSVHGHAVTGSEFLQAFHKHADQKILHDDRVSLIKNFQSDMIALNNATSQRTAEEKSSLSASTLNHSFKLLDKIQGMYPTEVPLVFGGASVHTVIDEDDARVEIKHSGEFQAAEVVPLSISESITAYGMIQPTRPENQ